MAFSRCSVPVCVCEGVCCCEMWGWEGSVVREKRSGPSRIPSRSRRVRAAGVGLRGPEMYNGIGLASVRGSGTNGYVQKNMAHVSRQRTANRKEQRGTEPRPLVAPRKANTEIVDHNRKRAVEVKCLALQEELEEQGLPDEQVEERVTALRSSLLAKLPPPGESSSGAGGRAGETHADAERKEAEAAALKKALGVSESYVPGQSFDRELQDRLKAERIAKREAEAQRVREAEEELEREREREERRQRKEARREEKEARREERKKRKHRHHDDDGDD